MVTGLEGKPYEKQLRSLGLFNLEKRRLRGYLFAVYNFHLKSKWRAVTSDIPQVPVLGLTLFNVFVDDTDSGIECTLSIFADNTKLCCSDDTVERRGGIQRDQARLQRWAYVNPMKFNKAKCKVLHVGWRNPKYRYSLGGEWTEKTPAKKDLGMRSLMMLQAVCAYSPKSQLHFGLHQKKCDQQVKGGDPAPLVCSALVRTHPEHYIQLWCPQHRKDMDLLEQSRRWATKMIRELEHLIYEDKLRELELFSLENRRLWRHLMAPFST
ncbi:rna-directed dna polymerase from mobile element jockey-like [Pitangus sulphuratus]|nr:rna-directed dna polymerase from mobile element jockey-like [Pitangus sulphuratus]